MVYFPDMIHFWQTQQYALFQAPGDQLNTGDKTIKGGHHDCDHFGISRHGEFLFPFPVIKGQTSISESNTLVCIWPFSLEFGKLASVITCL